MIAFSTPHATPNKIQVTGHSLGAALAALYVAKAALTMRGRIDALVCRASRGIWCRQAFGLVCKIDVTQNSTCEAGKSVGTILA